MVIGRILAGRVGCGYIGGSGWSGRICVIGLRAMVRGVVAG
jgi:hypothetical protein